MAALPDELGEALSATVAERGAFGARLFYAAEVGSTNDLAAAAAERGEPEGTTFGAGRGFELRARTRGIATDHTDLTD